MNSDNIPKARKLTKREIESVKGGLLSRYRLACPEGTKAAGTPDNGLMVKLATNPRLEAFMTKGKQPLSKKEIEAVKGGLLSQYKFVPEEGTGKGELPPY
ncbi:MAG: hypothetical protein JHC61_14330 [Burkholderiaceae bacterium]|nr:hypothetical protein [Burkholderiaceae bacterium]